MRRARNNAFLTKSFFESTVVVVSKIELQNQIEEMLQFHDLTELNLRLYHQILIKKKLQENLQVNLFLGSTIFTVSLNN